MVWDSGQARILTVPGELPASLVQRTAAREPATLNCHRRRLACHQHATSDRDKTMAIKRIPSIPTISASLTSAAPKAPQPMAPLALTPLPPPGKGTRVALEGETPHLLRQAYFADRQGALLNSLSLSQPTDSALTPQQRSVCERLVSYLAARAAQ